MRLLRSEFPGSRGLPLAGVQKGAEPPRSVIPATSPPRPASEVGGPRPGGYQRPMGILARLPMLSLVLAACGDPSSRHHPLAGVTSPATTTSGSTPSGSTGSTVAGPALSPAPAQPCHRRPSFDDAPGGRALRLDLASIGASPDPVAPLVSGSPVELTVTGAEPGEALELWVGNVCGLDCPVDRDGACFQPADEQRIGSAVADAAGRASSRWRPTRPGPSGGWCSKRRRRAAARCPRPGSTGWPAGSSRSDRPVRSSCPRSRSAARPRPATTSCRATPGSRPSPPGRTVRDRATSRCPRTTTPGCWW